MKTDLLYIRILFNMIFGRYLKLKSIENFSLFMFIVS